MSRSRQLLAVLAVALCTLTIPNAAPAAGRLCLWCIHGRTNTVFLLGSIHMLPVHTPPLDPRIEAAFKRAEAVVFEIDFDQASAATNTLETRGMLPGGTRLDALVPAHLRRRLTAELDTLGLRWRDIDHMKPWRAALTLSDVALERAGYDPARGLDRVLYRRATACGKQIVALETASQQIELLDRLGPRTQIELLKHSADEIPSLVPQARHLLALWRTGDTRNLATTLATAFRGTPQLYDILVVRRNRAWLPRIVHMTRQTHDVLVVVGTLHLVGKDGLVHLCRQAGLTVTQE